MAATGDKVRVKTGLHAGARGIVDRIEAGKLVVRLEDSRLIRVLPDDLTNYSLAARKAWITEPNRAVGRRKGTKLCDRVSVTLRLDRDLWKEFMAMEEEGVIGDRTAIINSWLREKLAQLGAGEHQS